MKGLPPLELGDHVMVQNQTGNQPLRWAKRGVVVEVLPYRQYKVRMDGSRRISLRNRKFLRKFIPIREDYGNSPMPLPTTDTSYTPTSSEDHQNPTKVPDTPPEQLVTRAPTNLPLIPVPAPAQTGEYWSPPEQMRQPQQQPSNQAYHPVMTTGQDSQPHLPAQPGTEPLPTLASD